MKVKFKGLNRLKKLAKASPSTGEKIRKVVRFHSGRLHERATRKSPNITGNLERSHVLRMEENGMVGHLIAYADYSGYVHEGTRFKAGKPWMQEALRETAPELFRDLEKLAINLIGGE